MEGLDWIAKWANYSPEKVALTCYDSNKNFTYLALDNYANRLVEKFKTMDIQEGDRIAVLSEHSVPYIVIFIACLRLGAILVPLNYRLVDSELKNLIKDCNPKLLLFNDYQENKLSLLQLNKYLKISINSIIHFYTKPIISKKTDYVIKSNNPIFIFYTSGTTGTPKGVLYTNKMMFWNSLNTSMQLGISYRDSTLNILPPYHTSGWNVFITPLLHKGAHIGMLRRFDADQVLSILELSKTTLFMALPTTLRMMQNSKTFNKVTLTNIRQLISGGENVKHKLLTNWRNQKNITIRPGYGLTEAGPSITSLHQTKTFEYKNSIGKPNFYLSVKIVTKNNKEARINEIGELCIKGDIVTPGYWNNSVETKNKIKNGWLLTGDYAYFDKNGFIYLKGRKDDMYISGGENIYPSEIENALEEIIYVNQAVVLPFDDEKWGQIGVAFIKLNKKTVDIKKELLKQLKFKIGSYKCPKNIIILDEIPLTSLGKISRKKLITLYKTTHILS